MSVCHAVNERTTVRLPIELLARAKRKAAAEGRTLTSLVEDGLRRVVDERKPLKQRVMPPIDPAKGTELVDISDSAALQEMDDLEYVERMKRFR